MALDFLSQQVIIGLAQSGLKPAYEQSIADVRAAAPLPVEMYGEIPEIFEEKTVVLPVETGEITIYILKPQKTTPAVLVYYHGGGWVMGDANDTNYNIVGKKLARQSGYTVVMVNYRKAPENPWPAAIDDSYAALQWVSENKKLLTGSNAVSLIVAGDSAGGNISAVMTHKSKNENGPKIDLQVLIYPVTSDDFETASYNDPENQLLLNRPFMEWFWNHYVPNKKDRKHPYVSPIYAADFSQLPAAILITVQYDPLRDEGEAYAKRLCEAGVPLVFKRLEGQMHTLINFPNILPQHAELIDFMVKHMKLYLE